MIYVQEETPKEKITRARTKLIFNFRYFANLVLQMPLVEDETVETGSTNGKRIRYNPKFIDELSLPETMFFLGHEALHKVCGHHFRQQGRDHDTWNIACDYEINPILVECGMTPIEGALINDDFTKRGLVAEQIYDLLPKNQGGGKNGKKPGKGSGSQQGNDPGRCGAVTPMKGKNGGRPTPNEVAKEKQNTKLQAQAAAQIAKAAGQLPGGLERLVNKIVKPKLDTAALLRQFVETNAKDDYSWSPPNRRYIAQGLYLPSLSSEQLGTVLFILDTSGSISQRDIDQQAAIVSDALEGFPTTETYVVYVDTKVAHVEKFTHEDLPIKLHPHGGGGTDFKPGFEWAEKNNIDPVCCLYLTDLCCSSYPPEPQYPVMWITLGGWDGQPPFGEVIKIDV